MRKLIHTLQRLAAACLLTASVQSQTPPNILLIVVDDLGYGELDDANPQRMNTPHMDSIARTGVRFSQAYVTAPYCAPSRAGFLTGRYQTRFGYDFNPVGKRNLDPELGLPLEEVTLAKYLQNAGYKTGLVGKWHQGANLQHHPVNRGFDEFYGFLHEGHFYAPTRTPGVTSFLRTNALPNGLEQLQSDNVIWSTHMGHNEPHYDTDNPILRGHEPVNEDEFLTDAWAREAIAFLERHQEVPWFLFLSYNAPHSPMQAEEEYLRRFDTVKDIQRRIFTAMVAHLDDSIGRVLEALQRLDLEERTLIIFFSDHGGPTRELTSSNAPFRGGKGTLYEGGLRIPFFMKWNGKVPEGRRFQAPITTLDVAPTVLAAAGIEEPNAEMDGVNLLPWLLSSEQPSPDRALYWRYGDRYAMRKGAWKIVRERGQEGFALYNLGDDPGEIRDLAAARPELLESMKSRLAGWERTIAPAGKD